MQLLERAHALHRVWRYRLRSERQEIAYLLSRNLAGATVADIGANRGIYSYWMHKAVGPTGNVVAFEPQPELQTYLADLKRTFKLDHLTIVPKALSSAKGERRLVRPKHHWGGASLHLDPHDGADSLAIQTTTLDEYFMSNPLRPLRFLKADIQGHEFDCFLGGSHLLRIDRPEILCESLDNELPQVAELLSRLEYRGYFFLRGKLTPLAELPQLRKSIASRYLNYVFLPAEAKQPV
ncbi:MAG: FkbM family methyltransferase [Planctomycetales bacterium]|nr:FkbM family methyltransferase [Planctomycetales bacterium]MBN8628246.1 FkbM family methyltransferase [Planctomycetota bacterium]